MMAEVRLDDARRQKYLGIAAREAHRLERLIGDLLDTARLEAGGGELDPEDVRLAELFDRVIAHHEFERVTRKIQIDAAVGPGAELVFGDPFRLEQALVNVTANALRHSPDGGRIALAANLSDGLVRITVTDWGEGIAPEHLPLIFDRFYKARAGRADGQREGGSGLGLSIVRAIVIPPRWTRQRHERPRARNDHSPRPAARPSRARSRVRRGRALQRRPFGRLGAALTSASPPV